MSCRFTDLQSRNQKEWDRRWDPCDAWSKYKQYPIPLSRLI